MNLSSRMKYYESKDTLLYRTPFIVRLDGNAFHRVTKRLKFPYDLNFRSLMAYIMENLANELEGAVYGYTQSDEITLCFMPYRRYDSQTIYGGKIQKITSLLAAKATSLAYTYLKTDSYLSATLVGPICFDCRVFNVPNIEELLNNVTWRINDAERCSTNALGQSYYTEKELRGIKLKELREKIFQEQDVRWEELPDELKRGYMWNYVTRNAQPCPREWKDEARNLLMEYVVDK